MPCAAAEGVAKRFLTRCSRCLNQRRRQLRLPGLLDGCGSCCQELHQQEAEHIPTHPASCAGRAHVGVDFGELNEYMRERRRRTRWHRLRSRRSRSRSMAAAWRVAVRLSHVL